MDKRTPPTRREGRKISAPCVSVIMPTYAQEAFIGRAIQSVLAQTFADWELIVVDDGSPGDVQAAIAPYTDDRRLRYVRLDENVGVGAALNAGIERARGELIAYLPSDDVYYAEHLESLVAALDADEGAVLAFSGIRHHYNRMATGRIHGEPMQLAQVMHRKSLADANGIRDRRSGADAVG
jgi:glycosyltransferase involved in cell wall biosynthesis